MSGSLVRLQGLGLVGDALDARDQARASLTVLGFALSAFLLFGIGIWAQMAIGWQWSPPDNRPTVLAMMAMSIAVGAFALLGVLAAAPLAWSVLRGLARRGRSDLWRAAVLFVGSMAVLIVGSRHFANGWPGTGGHHWADRWLVPGGIAAFSWATTLSVTSYWAHPAALLHFPLGEVAWMAVSPLAIIGVTIASAKTIHRLDLSEGVLAFEARLARAACFVMMVFLTGGLGWIVDGGPGPRDLFHAGVIDLVGIGVMVASLAVALIAVGRVHQRDLRPLVG